MKNVKESYRESYNGQRNPYRRNSKDYQKFVDERDWWMNNLNMFIINDYLEKVAWKLNSLEFTNELLKEQIREQIEEQQYRNELWKNTSSN